MDDRIFKVYKPKTRRCYAWLFRNFLGFCVCSNIKVENISLQDFLAYLEYLVENGVSFNMVANNLSTLKASFIMHGLHNLLLDHPRFKLIMKSMKINLPLSVVKRNIMSLETLTKLIHACEPLHSPNTFKAIFLLHFSVFLGSPTLPHIHIVNLTHLDI